MDFYFLLSFLQNLTQTFHFPLPLILPHFYLTLSLSLSLSDATKFNLQSPCPTSLPQVILVHSCEESSLFCPKSNLQVFFFSVICVHGGGVVNPKRLNRRQHLFTSPPLRFIYSVFLPKPDVFGDSCFYFWFVNLLQNSSLKSSTSVNLQGETFLGEKMIQKSKYNVFLKFWSGSNFYYSILSEIWLFSEL